MKSKTFGAYAVALVVPTVLSSALLTTFSILDAQYRIAHNSYPVGVKDAPVVPESWYSMLARIMAYVSVFLPIVLIVWLSLSYFRASAGSSKKRYAKAFGFSCLILPLICLQYLPWTIYQVAQTPEYLHYDEFMFMLAWLPFYCALVVLLSLCLNGVAWFRQKREDAGRGALSPP